jgi:hypothetical protein
MNNGPLTMDDGKPATRGAREEIAALVERRKETMRQNRRVVDPLSTFHDLPPSADGRPPPRWCDFVRHSVTFKRRGSGGAEEMGRWRHRPFWPLAARRWRLGESAGYSGDGAEGDKNAKSVTFCHPPPKTAKNGPSERRNAVAGNWKRGGQGDKNAKSVTFCHPGLRQ